MVQQTKAQRAPATCARSQASESRSAKGRFYAYRISPPKDTPFLPSEEAILTFVESYPEVTYLKTERLPDRDILIVKVRPNCNIFRSHATKEERALRRIFLRDVAERTQTVRGVPVSIEASCRDYLARMGFISLTWRPNKKHTGGWFECTSSDGRPIPPKVLGLTKDPERTKLIHACAPYDAFTLEAAPP